MSGIFDRHYKKYDSWYGRHACAYLSELEALKKAIPKTGKGLEIGVGTGRFAYMLGIQYGVDPSKNMLKIAEKRGIRVRLGVAEKLPFGSRTFDYVAIIITLCFVKDPRKAIREARRVLKKRGRIIIAVIDKDSFLAKSYQRKNSIFYKQAHFYGVRELADLLKVAGFDNVSFQQTLYDLPGRIKVIQKPKKGHGRGGFAVISAYKTTFEKKGVR